MPRGPEERDERAVLGRRGFLAASAGAFLCTIGGERVQLARPGDAAKADAAAARVRRPRTARAAAAAAPGAGPTEAMTFATPAPQPGGTVREYWIAARDARWDVIPSRPRRDQWHGRPLRGPSAFRAFVYQEHTPGFAAPRGAPSIPGPLLTGEVGDVIRVHFRNGLSSRYPQALTMHPHGVKYNPDYDGVYLGDFTRAGGFVAPGEEFTYTWECTPDSVGAWPYHDHGPNHTLNTFRGLFGALVVRRRGERPPDVEVPLFLHALQPPVTGLRVQFQCINGRAYAGNTPTIAARVGQDVALHVFGMDSNFHDFHIHGHRWRDAAGQFVDTPTVGPNETTTVRFVEDNPGRWLYHCHVFSHQDAGMAGWYLVTPSSREKGENPMTTRRRTSTALAAAAATALALPAAAPAANYPPPANPGASQGKPRGPFRTVTVCAPKAQKAKRCVRSIQKAVNRARPGDTVRLPNGTYRQSVKIFGARKRYLRLVGNPKDPSKVVLDGARLRGAAKQNGVFIKDADQVTVKGITATRFNGNGFFVLNATGYTLTRLRAMQTGVYGVYAFNSRGGTMSDSVAAWNNDSGFYIGQTPPQSRPIRSFVRNVSAYGNVLGFSGTNMRYVTITRSRWFNNGLGIVPNALDSEKFAPPEDNEIVDNDIFWNNFDYYKGAPFKLRKEATGTPYPVGTGVLLFGGRRTRVEGNRVYGNFLVGVGGVQQVLLKQQDAQQLVGNVVRNNVFGAGGSDLNGRDLYYDGDGTDNCWGPNTTLSPNEPADDSTFAACPFTGANAFRQDVQAMALAWAVDPQESHWIRHGHAPKPGYTPLETYVPGQTPMEQPSK